MHAAGDVRIEDVPDPSIVDPTDAIVRVTSACICGSDLWPYADMEPSETGQSMGHEAIGVVEDVGDDVRIVKRGDLVVMPFAYSDGSCEFCHEGLHTACVHVGFFGNNGVNGAQAEALRVPRRRRHALPAAGRGGARAHAALLTLSDVLGTGRHAAVVAGVQPGDSVAVVGDGAVGLCGVIAAKRLGAEQIIIMGRHEDRTALARELGATDVVAERGDAAVERVLQLTRGVGVHAVLECVGTEQSTQTSVEITRPGGSVGRVGVPHYPAIPQAQPMFYKNVKVGGGPAPVRAYIDELLQDILEGRIEPANVFDRTVDLDGPTPGARGTSAPAASKQTSPSRRSARTSTTRSTPPTATSTAATRATCRPWSAPRRGRPRSSSSHAQPRSGKRADGGPGPPWAGAGDHPGWLCHPI
jgi:threonine dehydrogenase-like Zn-dependent dehydrogenase